MIPRRSASVVLPLLASTLCGVQAFVPPSAATVPRVTTATAAQRAEKTLPLARSGVDCNGRDTYRVVVAEES